MVQRFGKLSKMVSMKAFLTVVEKETWLSFKHVDHNYLRNNKTTSYTKLQNMVNHFKKLNCQLSLKLCFLHSHRDFFSD